MTSCSFLFIFFLLLHYFQSGDAEKVGNVPDDTKWTFMQNINRKRTELAGWTCTQCEKERKKMMENNEIVLITSGRHKDRNVFSMFNTEFRFHCKAEKKTVISLDKHNKCWKWIYKIQRMCWIKMMIFFVGFVSLWQNEKTLLLINVLNYFFLLYSALHYNGNQSFFSLQKVFVNNRNDKNYYSP